MDGILKRHINTMSSRSSTYRAGAASICITPQEPLWMAGYAARTAPSRGKISDLFASALAIEDAGGHRFVLVSVDIIAITPIIADVVIEAARCRHGLSRDQMMLVPTHTHYGPEFRPDKQEFFNIPPEFATKLPEVASTVAAAVVQAIDDSISRLEPATMFVRQTRAHFAHNRRRRGVKEGAASTEDVVDHDTPVLDCVDAAGRRNAIVFGYACHNTTIPADDCRYCGDWAGFAREHLQAMHPGATILFVPGAGADQDPEPHGSIELSQQHGREIAEAIHTSLQGPGIELSGSFSTAFELVSLPLQPLTQDALEQMQKSDDPPRRVKAKYLLNELQRGEELITSYGAPIQIVRLGNELLIISLSGEPVVDWARKFKHEAGCHCVSRCEFPAADSKLQAPRPPLTWVAGYCNDMFGYLPTRRIQAEGGYEGGRANLWSWIPAPFTDDVERQVTQAVHRLLGQVGAGGWGLGVGE
jgi:hypothetical protein